MTAAVRLSSVSKRFGAKVALAGLDLAVPAASVFGFLGPNGAGKSTTLRILLGLVTPDAGSVDVMGFDPRVDPAGLRARVGVLLDHDGHYDRLSAAQNLAFHASIHGLEGAAARARIETCLRGAGLWERKADRVSTFSKGMRQKLAVARTLLHEPPLVLLDEPFTGLDPAAAIELRETIRALAREGTTVLLTTHDLHHVERVCDQLAVIRAGTIVATGAPDSLAREADRALLEVYVAGEGASDALLEAMKQEGALAGYRREGTGVLVRCTPAQRPRLGTELVRRGVILEELATHRSTLEEAFVKLVAPSGAPS